MKLFSTSPDWGPDHMFVCVLAMLITGQGGHHHTILLPDAHFNFWNLNIYRLGGKKNKEKCRGLSGENVDVMFRYYLQLSKLTDLKSNSVYVGNVLYVTKYVDMLCVDM